MTKYLRKMTEVEAWKFTSKDIENCQEWIKHSDVYVMPPIGELKKGIPYIEVYSVLGTLNAFEGDYIIKSENDQVYVIDSRVFKLYYEEVEAEVPQFDQEKALTGKPVKLRNGTKAYVLGDLRNLRPEVREKRCLIGGTFVVDGDRITLYDQMRWRYDGRYFENIICSEYDIIGMWEDN